MQSTSLNLSTASSGGRVSVGDRKPAPGFTLIELLVALAIVGILAAIAYPSYRTQVEKTRRADAQAVLMQAAQYLERVYTEGGCYKRSGGLCNGADAFPYTKAPLDGGEIYYDIGVAAAVDSFELTAFPQGAEEGAGVLTLDQTGRRGWDRNTDGDTLDPGEDRW